MSHLLERFIDGTTGFASSDEDSWHRLGQTHPGVMTAEELMDLAKLGGWNVRKLVQTGVDITAEGVTVIENPDKVMHVRTNPVTGTTDYLGTVGANYGTIQNEDNCETLNFIAQEFGAQFETGGSLRDGREVFVTMRLPDKLTLASIDQVDLYLAALNSHDGTSAFRILVTPVRIVCANTQQMAIEDAKASIKIRHTSGARAKITEARKALGLVEKYRDAFVRDAEHLMDRELTVPQLKEIIGKVWPAEAAATKRADTIRLRRENGILELFTTAATNDTIRGTAWAAEQSIGEWFEHHAPAPDELVRATRWLTNDDVSKKLGHAHRLLMTV